MHRGIGSVGSCSQTCPLAVSTGLPSLGVHLQLHAELLWHFPSCENLFGESIWWQPSHFRSCRVGLSAMNQIPSTFSLSFPTTKATSSLMVETSQDDRIDANGTTGCDCGDIVASSPPSSTPARYASVYDLLPPELIDNVLSHLPRSALQHTALALTRAVPTAGVTLQHLFTAIRITRDEQAVQLVKRLGPRSPDASAAKQCATSLSCEAWRWVVARDRTQRERESGSGVRCRDRVCATTRSC